MCTCSNGSNDKTERRIRKQRNREKSLKRAPSTQERPERGWRGGRPKKLKQRQVSSDRRFSQHLHTLSPLSVPRLITSRSPSAACLYHLTQYHPHKKPDHSFHEALSRITSLLTYSHHKAEKNSPLSCSLSPKETITHLRPIKTKPKNTPKPLQKVSFALSYTYPSPHLSLYCVSLSFG